jgi:UDP-glucose 4-epimerase
LVDRLLADGHEVAVIDNFATGRLENLKAAASSGRFMLHRADIADFETVRPLFTGVDWVFHLAAMADIVPSIQRPMVYHHANVDGTIVALEASRASGVNRFLYAASSSCYGIPEVYPTPESAPIRPMYPYALTKNLGEQYVMHWHKVYGLSTLALRLFNVFGPRHRTSGTYGAVFGVFLAQKLAKQPFTVVGDGTQTRDFTFVTDVADAFVTAAKSGLVGRILNVGSGHTNSVNRLVALLGGPKVNLPKRPGEPDCTFADITLIRREFGWEPHVRFEDGVRIMLENIEGWRDAPVWTVEKIDEATADWFKHLGRPQS